MRKKEGAPEKALCDHRGQAPVRVGPYSILAGGRAYFEEGDLDCADMIVSLGAGMPDYGRDGKRRYVIGYSWPDYGPPPASFRELLEDEIIPALKRGEQVLIFCYGSHGRTGTTIASLIAILEPETEDPVAAARERHCEHAVETRAQAAYVFGLRGQLLPAQYYALSR